MKILGLDIGGANLKVADGQGYAAAEYFPLWQKPEGLSLAIGDLLANAPEAELLAITMTGELADCFATKREGVETILRAVESSAVGRQVSVYLCDGRFADVDSALAESVLAAASNWHVLGKFATRFCEKNPGLLLDIGSTSTDIIPLSTGGPITVGQTDPQRLQTGELVYTGVERSPICAVTPVLSWGGEECAVAQELFATTVDAYLLLGEIEEDAGNLQSADGRPRTKKFARDRMARAICADSTMFSEVDAMQSAEIVREAQLTLLDKALGKVLKRMEALPRTIVLSGHGEFLARRLIQRMELDCRLVSLKEELGADVNRSACAHALAVLLREEA